jgi:hypothetical protein
MTDRKLPEETAEMLAILGYRPNLSRLIEAARGHKMTQAELDAQRRSFVRGEMGLGSDKDEAAYAKALRENDAATLARLDTEAQARMRAADALAADPVIASGDHSETMRHVMTRTLGPLLGVAGIILGVVVAALLVWGA